MASAIVKRCGDGSCSASVAQHVTQHSLGLSPCPVTSAKFVMQQNDPIVEDLFIFDFRFWIERRPRSANSNGADRGHPNGARHGRWSGPRPSATSRSTRRRDRATSSMSHRSFVIGIAHLRLQQRGRPQGVVADEARHNRLWPTFSDFFRFFGGCDFGGPCSQNSLPSR